MCRSFPVSSDEINMPREFMVINGFIRDKMKPRQPLKSPKSGTKKEHQDFDATG
jgi:hypothetical protein